MKWLKRCLIYNSKKENNWAYSHAMIPTPELINKNIIRIYITVCDKKGIGRITFIDVDSQNPSKIVNKAKRPILDIGAPGTFDENGILVCSIVNLPNLKKYLYYVGFELGYKIRYRLLTGLAVSSDNVEIFKRFKNIPILERSDSELYFRGGPFVMYENKLFKMWYVAGSEWVEIDGKDMPVYIIKYLESEDGINWEKEGKICIDIENENEHGFGRPYVIKGNDIYKMFYSIRVKHKGYRLGYAESNDGINWVRKDSEIGIDVSENGWDSEMICYSSVIKVKDKTYMFYNGNQFGKTGFGYAELVAE